jgi:hypothetical protein
MANSPAAKVEKITTKTKTKAANMVEPTCPYITASEFQELQNHRFRLLVGEFGA